MLRPSTHDLRESGWQEVALTTSCRFARAYRSRTNLITKHSICIIVSLSWAVNHYRDNAMTYKEQRDKATSTIADMQKRQRDVAELDARYPNRMPVGSGNQLAKWNGWNYFHRKEPCDNGSE